MGASQPAIHVVAKCFTQLLQYFIHFSKQYEHVNVVFAAEYNHIFFGCPIVKLGRLHAQIGCGLESCRFYQDKAHSSI